MYHIELDWGLEGRNVFETSAWAFDGVWMLGRSDRSRLRILGVCNGWISIWAPLVRKKRVNNKKGVCALQPTVTCWMWDFELTMQTQRKARRGAHLYNIRTFFFFNVLGF